MSDAELRSHTPELPSGWTHWIAATQTCNLFSVQFDRIKLTEWLGASEASVDAILASGSHPRQFQCVATLVQGGELILNCDIQARHWSDRRVLANISSIGRLVDEPGQKRKDDFIGWVARSYTRLELSDELNTAIADSTLAAFVKSIVKSHKDRLYGIFLNVASDLETSAAKLKPSADEKCGIAIIFVANSEDDRNFIKPLVDEGFKTKVGNPKWGIVDGASKQVSRATRAAHFHLLANVEVRFAGDWTAGDISESIRYSLSDHLSDSTAAV